jgi:hypothetical protein
MTKEYSIRTKSYAEELIPETVLDDADPIHDMKRLAGLTSGLNVGALQEYKGEGSVSTEGSNVSKTAMEKVNYQNEHNIQPGTPEWFRLWFSLPKLTGEKPW